MITQIVGVRYSIDVQRDGVLFQIFIELDNYSGRICCLAAHYHGRAAVLLGEEVIHRRDGMVTSTSSCQQKGEKGEKDEFYMFHIG